MKEFKQFILENKYKNLYDTLHPGDRVRYRHSNSNQPSVEYYYITKGSPRPTWLLDREDDKPAIEWGDRSREWYRMGKRHRDGDKPAVMHVGDSPEYSWYQNNQLHRDGDKPAFITPTAKLWYKHGMKHRDGDRPAYVDIYGKKIWYKNGLVHRDGDQPACIDHEQPFPNGTVYMTKTWYQNGDMHRDNDEPAVIRWRDGEIYYQEWRKNGQLHRVDGPATIETSTFQNTRTVHKNWYLNGVEHTEQEHELEARRLRLLDAYKNKDLKNRDVTSDIEDIGHLL